MLLISSYTITTYKKQELKGGNEKMTNETQEQTQNRGRLLVIDDNPIYALNAVRAARARGYEVDVAFDLKGAMSYLQSGSYAGVITDLQFFEDGIGDVKRIDSRETLSDLEKGLIEPAQTKTEVKADPQLRERIASELATPENSYELTCLLGSVLGRAVSATHLTQQAIKTDLIEKPAMGYEVIRYAQEHSIPFAVVSSVDHGHQCIPALFQTRLADADSLMRHESVRNLASKELWSHSEEVIEPLYEKLSQGSIKEEELKAQKDKFYANCHRLSAIVLDKAVLVKEGRKEQHTYDFAIDMLEGRIDQTRPYKVGA